MLNRINAGGSPPVEILRALDAETGAAPAAETAAPSVESVLFPNDKAAPEAAAEQTPNEADKPDAAKADWKEYEPDPAKSEAENATAKAEHDKAKPAAPDPLDVVPEDGKYTLTMPEGVELDSELLDAIAPKLKAKGYTHRETQELVDDFIKTQQARGAKQGEAWSQTISKWADDAKADKEIGGQHWAGTVTNAQRVINQFSTPALKEYLNATGGGNHPEMIRFMAKVGAMIKEDNPATGEVGGAGQTCRSRSQTLSQRRT